MNQNTIKDLGDGLILRHATPADTEALVAFNGRIHAEPEADEPQELVAAWVQDLMTLPHPTFVPEDFTIVEDTGKGKIVSSLNLINQTWRYAGLEFGVGRPELVGTDPEYRRRGLVREQFKVIHEWSAARGHKMQVITGIPYYYRQFGYEMGLSLGGGRLGYLPHVPKLKEGEAEPYVLRPATEADIPFLVQVYEVACQRSLISCVWDEALWRYELNGRSEKNIHRTNAMLIESAEGEPVGFLLHPPTVWSTNILVTGYELKAGVSWLAVTPSVIRYAVKMGQQYATESKETLEVQAYYFNLGPEHPVYAAFSERMPRLANPYAWYVRIPDVADFLAHISPVLEERLAKSVLVGHSGDLKLGFYRSGVKLTFEQGKLKESSAYQPETGEDGDVLFPYLTFLRVLLGHNDFWEVENFFADCYVRNDAARALVPILFPKQGSNVWGVV